MKERTEVGPSWGASVCLFVGAIVMLVGGVSRILVLSESPAVLISLAGAVTFGIGFGWMIGEGRPR